MNKAQSAAEWFVVDGSGDTLTATGPFTQAVAWERWAQVPGHEADALVVRSNSQASAIKKVKPLF